MPLFQFQQNDGVGRPSLSWDGIADAQYIMRKFCDRAVAIPLMAGTVFSEFFSNLAKTPVWNYYLFPYEYPVNGGVTAFHCQSYALRDDQLVSLMPLPRRT